MWLVLLISDSEKKRKTPGFSIQTFFWYNYAQCWARPVTTTSSVKLQCNAGALEYRGYNSRETGSKMLLFVRTMNPTKADHHFSIWDSWMDLWEPKALLGVKRPTPRLTCIIWVRQPYMWMSDLKSTSPEFLTVWSRGSQKSSQYAPPWFGCSAVPVSLSTLGRMYGSATWWDLTCLRNWNLAVVLLFILMKTLPRMAATQLQELRQDRVNSANSANNRYISPTRKGVALFSPSKATYHIFSLITELWFKAEHTV